MKSDRMWAAADQAELVSRAQGADQWAFAELMRRTTGASLRLATGMLKNHHMAEDEVQNAYFKAWQHIHQFQGGSFLDLDVPHCGESMPDAVASASTIQTPLD